MASQSYLVTLKPNIYKIYAMLAYEMMADIVAQKRTSNKRMTLRWIATRMAVSSGQLSEVLRGKRNLTNAFLEKFCSALKLSTDEKNALRRAFQSSQFSSNATFSSVLSAEQVESLADWKSFALMSFFQTTLYTEIKKKSSKPTEQADAISKKINLPVAEVVRLLAVMNAAKLVCWRDGGWAPVLEDASTGVDIPNEALRNGYLEHLNLAAEKINVINVLQRDFSSVTLAMDPKDLDKAKKLLRAFRKDFVKKMEMGSKRAVFQMNIQFFPLAIPDDPV